MTKYKVVALGLLFIGGFISLLVFLNISSIAVLGPQGLIAEKQRSLIVVATLLMLIIVIPVFILTFVIAWKYRASNKSAKYDPNLDHNRLLETIWWGVPIVIITIISGLIWTSSHELDPYKALSSNKKPVTIQVVALQWKWLFIYPKENIASVNFVQFPEKTPINFEITSDAPMNSFWIPRLGGQVYAMTGMKTKLHLMADDVGSYRGSSANISGEGFSGMKFTAKSTSHADFEKWVQRAKQAKNKLSIEEYSILAKPSKNNPVTYYSSADKNLYDTVIMKYMPSGHNMPEMDH